jgi:molybdopterin converting factor small subunit
MIRISLHYFNMLAEWAGKRREILDLPEGADIHRALQVVSARYSPAFQAIVLPDGQPGSYLKVFRNGVLVDLEAMDTVLNENDELMLFPAVAGG